LSGGVAGVTPLVMTPKGLYPANDARSFALAYDQQQNPGKYDPRTGLLLAVAEDQTIPKLKDSIDNLKASTDSLNATNQDLLSPYYTQDPRTSHIGFRSQGMASGGYVDVPGSSSANDNMLAMIPV